ncbi:succinylglutamate desuccinylase/aspartoacylase family protein, partial [Candidatus Riflebacteria bacterium]
MAEIVLDRLKMDNILGMEISCPIIRLGSGKKKILFLAGIHGDEITGIVALGKLLHLLLKEKEIHGEIHIISVANPLALLSQKRENPVDNLDLNRI